MLDRTVTLDHRLLDGISAAAQELSVATSSEAVATLLGDVTAALPGVAATAVYLADGIGGSLREVATTADRASDAVLADALASVARESYLEGEPIVREGLTGNGDESVAAVTEPLGGFGALVVVPADSSLGGPARDTVSLLATVSRYRLEGLEGERILGRRTRERDRCTERLARTEDVLELFSGLERTVADAESQAALERTVCERFAGIDRVACAWIGRVDETGRHLVPSAAAGRERAYLDAVDRTLTVSNTEPAVVAARECETVVVDGVASGLQAAAWRREAHARGVAAVRAVPLVVDDRFDGVLTVYTSDASGASDLWGRAIDHVAAVLAHGIGSLNRKRALLSDAIVEVELELVGGNDVFGRLAREVGTDLHLEGVTVRDSETALFLVAPECDEASLESTIARDPAVISAQAVRRDDAGPLEVVIREEWLLSHFVDIGATPQSIEATGEGTRVVVTLPTNADVEGFVDSLGHRYDEVVLHSRRERTRPVAREQYLWAKLVESLTDRQLETLRTAYLGGYFEWPRESTGEEVAGLLDISQPTFSRHLRTAERKLLSLLFAPERD